MAADHVQSVLQREPVLPLAGDEQHFDARAHRKAFALAREAALHRTAHAGEAAGPASVRQALDLLDAERIGHGTRVSESPSLTQEMVERQIALEHVPHLELADALRHSLRAHPIAQLLAQGVRVTVSTYARTTPNISVSGEFEKLSREIGWGGMEFLACQRKAPGAAFVPDAERSALARTLNPKAASSS